MFRSTGSYEPDLNYTVGKTALKVFRSTGSYEPDPLAVKTLHKVKCFDPQALTSLTTGLSITQKIIWSFDPQALTSLTDLKTFGVNKQF